MQKKIQNMPKKYATDLAISDAYTAFLQFLNFDVAPCHLKYFLKVEKCSIFSF